MQQINVYKADLSVNLKQTRLKRDWMDETDNAHAYHCFPVSLANSIGYEISFPKEISFIWDGISDSTSEHVTILSGNEYVSSGRANATISFNTGLFFKTDENITLLGMPVPNLFIDGVQSFTSLISSSFYINSFPCAWRITRANEVITIPANQPIVTILPIPLKQISNIEMNIYKGKQDLEFMEYNKEYGNAAQKINSSGDWTDWYRNATDHTGNTIGTHELKSIKLKINDCLNEEYKIMDLK
jgi:hypothetical protein